MHFSKLSSLSAASVLNPILIAARSVCCSFYRRKLTVCENAIWNPRFLALFKNTFTNVSSYSFPSLVRKDPNATRLKRIVDEAFSKGDKRAKKSSESFAIFTIPLKCYLLGGGLCFSLMFVVHKQNQAFERTESDNRSFTMYSASESEPKKFESASDVRKPIENSPQIKQQNIYDSTLLTTSQSKVQEKRRRGDSLLSRLHRSTHAFWTALIIGADYKWSLWKLPRDSEEYRVSKSKLHLRSAERILRVCLTHGGLFNKAGQFIASLNHLLPVEYTRTLARLQDHASVMDYEDVQLAIREELHQEVEEIFSNFPTTPIASASLAQVHHAILRNGKEVAVKIQYLGLEKEARNDLRTFELILKGIALGFPDFAFSWVVPEFQSYLEMELGLNWN